MGYNAVDRIFYDAINFSIKAKMYQEIFLFAKEFPRFRWCVGKSPALFPVLENHPECTAKADGLLRSLGRQVEY